MRLGVPDRHHGAGTSDRCVRWRCGVAGVVGFPPVPTKQHRYSHVLPIAVIALIVAGISAVVALAIDWLPAPASTQSDRVDALIWWTVWASIGIFTIVVTFLLYSVWKFRAAEGDESDGPPLHGHTLLEIVWTAIPTVLIGVTAAWGAVVLIKNEDVAKGAPGPLTVQVLGQQFTWRFTYPDLGVTTGDLRVPTDRPIVLKMRSQDVIHDFFVYETRIKGDVVPGIVNTINFTMKSKYAGTVYPIVCAELCGAGHGIMRAQMITMTPARYDAWALEAKADAAAAKTR